MASTIAYRYVRPSSLGQSGLALSASSSHPGPRTYFRGFVERPDVVATALLVVARVARTRFTLTAQERAELRDPVVTSEPRGLHFESFSGCCGVHAHLELDEAGLDTEVKAPGTVNVDLNEPVRAALARVRPRTPLRLQVGDDAIEVTTLEGSAVERRVPLPERWVRGFAEVQTIGSALAPVLTLGEAAARRLISELPRGRAGRRGFWVQPGAAGVSFIPRSRGGAVWLAAPDRLRLLEPLLRHITGLRVHATPDAHGSSMWVAELPEARLTLGLSPELGRGFSGEGAVLWDLVAPGAHDDAEALDLALVASWRFGPADLTRSGLPLDRARRAVTVLGAGGRLAHDIRRGEWFRRDLPFPSAALRREPPRLRSARTLVADGAVLAADGGACVHSGDATYDVRLDPPYCSCTWWFEHPGDRGPCKHLLAAALAA